MVNYSEKEIVELLQINGPIGVCDGMRISSLPYFERLFISWLKFNGLSCGVEGNLYERTGYDLSLYKTIAFNTQGEAKQAGAFDKIIGSFSKENLKVVVVGNEKAYFKVKDLAGKLGIKLIGFDYYIPMIAYSKMQTVFTETGTQPPPNLLDDIWENDFEGLLFDPGKKFG